MITVFESLSLSEGSIAVFTVRWPGGDGYLLNPSGGYGLDVPWIALDEVINVNQENGNAVHAATFPTSEFPLVTGGYFWLPPCTIRIVATAPSGGLGAGPMRIFKK